MKNSNATKKEMNVNEAVRAKIYALANEETKELGMVIAKFNKASCDKKPNAVEDWLASIREQIASINKNLRLNCTISSLK